MSHPKNQVLTDDYNVSKNFYESDLILREYVNRYLSEYAKKILDEKLDQLGKVAATQMDELSQKADKNGPVLEKRNKFGEDIDEIEFHPAYWELMDIAAESEMFYLKYHPDRKGEFTGSRHQMGFALGQLYAMSELGQYCPHCMTDGAAYLIEQFADEKDKKRLLSRLTAKEGAELYSGAMFLTEKSGGSDVGANLCIADKVEGDRYRLNGEKWFCSNVNAEVIMALARTGPVEKGTRGLSLFLVEKVLSNGERNPMEIIRLKDKLGVRSMASAEVRFQDTEGKRLGDEGEGFKIMAQMINISRNYNSVAALAGNRRAIIEVWQYLNHRRTFGKRAVDHALIREKLLELGSKYLADFLLVWRGLRAMDAAEKGDEEEQHLLRMITPMAKWWSAENAVYSVRECMELMGGNGYIEDFVMPKLLRDINVLPIWEGSGNIIVLDMLRATEKSRGLDIIFEMIEQAADRSSDYGGILAEKLTEMKLVWKDIRELDDRDRMEASAKPMFKQLIRLFQMALLIEEAQSDGSKRYAIALNYLADTFDSTLSTHTPLDIEQIEMLIGWEY
ncbi:acyl-CoA dehydrogenase [Aliifodinibius salipaludis]|uniref:Acyl-CoA dehydrogenase n=1 Tax=Fodinibius salipaludis TaxID=2032627 RepID=A0A2A2GFR2_9BACT|nr:acyl-CoA dehydrogenase family protein [Aliifodinibius salipaludis]PAU95733.1 acyl-CoA dehydrogenase [Aliifodinibius salipaludis]